VNSLKPFIIKTDAVVLCTRPRIKREESSGYIFSGLFKKARQKARQKEDSYLPLIEGKYCFRWSLCGGELVTRLGLEPRTR